MNMDNTAFSVGWAARLLGLQYPDAIKLFKREQALVITLDEHLGVPAPWLLRFKAFRDKLRDQRVAIQRSDNYILPMPKLPLYQGYREVERSLPFKFTYDPEHHEKRLYRYVGDLVDEGEPAKRFGWIETPQELKALLLGDCLRGKPGSNATLRLLTNDLHNGFSWSSPAETSWRRGAGVLLDLVIKRREMENLAPRFPVAHQRGPRKTSEKKMRGAAPDPESGYPRADVYLMRPQAERYESRGLHFDFEPEGLGDLTANKDAYLATMPIEFLEAAYCDAAQWERMLCEERTGYLRALGHMNPDIFDKSFEEAEAAVYGNREAWENGVLQPFFPASFSFLF